MNPSKQVVSVGVARRLRDLGVKKEGLWYWFNDHLILGYGEGLREHETDMPHCWCDPVKEVQPNGGMVIIHKEGVPTYTVAELGEMLSLGLEGLWKGTDGKWRCSWTYCPIESGKDQPQSFESDTMADAMALMLIHLIESKIISPSDLTTPSAPSGE